MVINSTNNAISGLTALIQDERIQNRIGRQRRSSKIIQFPNRDILEQDIRRINLESAGNDKITADFTSQMYLHLLLVAGSRTLHRTRMLGSE